jgi:hypothetical protein
MDVKAEIDAFRRCHHSDVGAYKFKHSSISTNKLLGLMLVVCCE